MTKNQARCLMLLPMLALTAMSAAAVAAPALPTSDAVEDALEERLNLLGKRYGDEGGFIPLTTQAGETLYLSTAEPQQSFDFYATGDAVDESAVLAGCGVGNAGEPESCDEAYGYTVLVALEDLALDNPDLEPDEMRVDCELHNGEGTNWCVIYWGSGKASCWMCDGEDCYFRKDSQNCGS